MIYKRDKFSCFSIIQYTEYSKKTQKFINSYMSGNGSLKTKNKKQMSKKYHKKKQIENDNKKVTSIEITSSHKKCPFCPGHLTPSSYGTYRAQISHSMGSVVDFCEKSYL